MAAPVLEGRYPAAAHYRKDDTNPMATKQKQTGARPVSITPEDYQSMVDVMLELAYRNIQAEAMMVRVANAGGIEEVVAEIKKRRIYAKKMGMVRDRSTAAEVANVTRQPRKPQKVGGGRRRSDRKVRTRKPPAAPPVTSTGGEEEDVA